MFDETRIIVFLFALAISVLTYVVCIFFLKRSYALRSSFFREREVRLGIATVAFISSLFLLQLFFKQTSFSDVYSFVAEREWLVVTIIGTLLLSIILAAYNIYTFYKRTSHRDAEFTLFLIAFSIGSAALFFLLLSALKYFTGHWATASVLAVLFVTIYKVVQVMRRRREEDRRRQRQSRIRDRRVFFPPEPEQEVHAPYADEDTTLISRSLLMIAAARVCVLLVFVVPLVLIVGDSARVFIVVNLLVYLLLEALVYVTHRNAARRFFRG